MGGGGCTLRVVTRTRGIYLACALLAVAIVLTGVWLTRTQPSDGGRQGEACTVAGQAKLDPLVTLPSGEVTVEEISGNEWAVATEVNHQTKWADHWYVVSCTVVRSGDAFTVTSVDAVQRS
jgi:hypothetical protein